MGLESLKRAVERHEGEFLCEKIQDGNTLKRVAFRHRIDPPEGLDEVPDIGRLRDFYRTFGGITFYCDAQSGDAARRIAPPSAWPTLREYYLGWLVMLGEDEREECLPGGADTCLVIGETPCSGNYILVVTQGEEAGHVFEFDHDGFEFDDLGADIVAYVETLLAPDAVLLTNMASHLRFVEGDSKAQWWIREMRDCDGRVVSTRA